MTYSLNTLRATARQAPVAPTGMGRFANEITLIVGFVGLVLWLVALLTYAPQDAAWSTSGAGMPVLNRVGRLGAWVADLSYFVLGFSVWWCVVVARQVSPPLCWSLSLSVVDQQDCFHHGREPGYRAGHRVAGRD